MNAKLRKMLVDPRRPITFVASQVHRPCDWIAFAVTKILVSCMENRLKRGCLVCLATSDNKGKEMAQPVDQKMNLRRKSPAGSS
ncbi:hypothetical protein Mal15_64530 [Stieleria maiorica]|uniref:Uncharacterized protein n=1 Tax=Stieleria maiorica TaxID=2795974 RepID=A0A5B9MPN0_9BACT|nr:hypothetical protein Mal15_64070 [Stieleria maiorica]QEG02366.1 hypothetical protein Mal15_64530 [Stieleria maiorica]